jgi:Fe2+ transport system protein B
MNKFKVDKETKQDLLELYRSRQIYLEGNILKLIDTDGDSEFELYLQESIKKDKDGRRKRLEITKQIQSQNKELVELNKENDRVNHELKSALEEAEMSRNEAINSKEEADVARVEAERARNEAEKARVEAEKAREEAINDLELEQRKSQFELIGTIVRIALMIIIGVGVTTTLIYAFALLSGADTTNIFTTWSNIIGILLTNAFSIVGTIMGVKYASEKKSN